MQDSVDAKLSGLKVFGYGKINVVVGKNGSGKSTLLRNMDEILTDLQGCIRYITPERGGELTYDGHIETSRSSNPAYMIQSRRTNRWDQFRQSSVAEFRNLETLVLRSIEKRKSVRATDFSFDAEVEKINGVLDRVRLARAETAGFEIYDKIENRKVRASDLSSGESELISLSVEILNFCYLCRLEKFATRANWLLMDEPDVHLHPDLQHRLMRLLTDAVEESNCRVVIATHSTAILSSLCDLGDNVRVGFKHIGVTGIHFKPVDDVMLSVLPMFGAHPLSNVFNERPPLIVEGEDDERIWQAAVRRSGGRLKLYPCVASDVQSMNRYEMAARDLIEAVYDNARAYSLRDRDDGPYEIENIGTITRMRLSCRSAENLILTDDVLDELGTTWDTLRATLESWIDQNPTHRCYADANAFSNGGWDRYGFRLKSLRMLIVGLTGSNKPWEVAVGQAIAQMPERRFSGHQSLEHYLGTKTVQAFGLLNE